VSHLCIPAPKNTKNGRKVPGIRELWNWGAYRVVGAEGISSIRVNCMDHAALTLFITICVHLRSWIWVSEFEVFLCLCFPGELMKRRDE